MKPKSLYQKMRENREANLLLSAWSRHRNNEDEVRQTIKEVAESLQHTDQLKEKPWYPDGGEWVEVPDDCITMPEALSPDTLVEVLKHEERTEKDFRSMPEKARFWTWDLHSQDMSRIVAYKVVAP